ncbi:MAG TPA: glycosyltransferase family 4 protein [Casimicrobiaceae bacterium]
MRLLFVGCNSGGGGTESHLIALARALAEAGHDVAAAVRADDFIHRGLAQDPRIHLYPLEFRGRRDLRAMRELSRITRSLEPDWMIGAFKAEYWALALVAKSAGVPLVLFSHLDQRIRPLMLSQITGLVRSVIVPSEYLRRRSIERGLPASRVAVLSNPFDVDCLKPDAALRARVRASLGISDDQIVLGYVGRFEPPKGVVTLARATAKAMDSQSRLRALWVGHGRLEPALREIARNSGHAARNHWMPWLDHVLPAYAAMDVVALPSEGSETFGRVLVEAQAHGLPVLGADNGGIPEALVEDRTGRLVPPGDVDAWAAAIGEMAGNDVLRRRFGAAARPFAARFDSARIAGDFISMLESLESLESLEPRGDAARVEGTVPPLAPVTLARKVGAD